MNEIARSFHIEMRSYRIIGWVGSVFFLAAAVGSFFSGVYWASAGFALFGAGCIYLILGSGSVDFDESGLTHKSFFGTWHIRWDEISGAEEGATDGTLVLLGADKHFVLASPQWWSGADRDDALRLVVRKLDEQHVVPQATRSAAYKLMKNTRLK